MLNLVAIGDSIAKGVGSSNAKTKSFAALIGDKVDGKVTNLGITGLDSTQLIEKLKTEDFQKVLEQADVIFVSIGFNDLLKPFLSIVAEAASVKGDGKELYTNLQKRFAKLSKQDPLKAGDALATAAKRIDKSKELSTACKQFPKNFQTIIKQLKEINPTAVIYADNVYNPYYGVVYEYQGLTLLNIHDMCETYISELNKAFDRNSKDYILMDMYSIFRQEGYTNVNPASIENMSGVNFDPHPNDAGYQMMADYIYTQMDTTAPHVDVILNCDEMSVPVDLAEMQLLFDESVRISPGKVLQLRSEDQTYSYILEGNEQLVETNDGKYQLTLSMQDFLGKDQDLACGQQYELVMEEGAFKDKGNNSPENLTFFGFQTEGVQEVKLEANSAAVINQPMTEKAEKAHKIIGSSIWILILVAVAIALIMRYNKNHVKNKSKVIK
ncbi:MAG: hypothetical protein HFI75_14120 [Lachnospiraceae bacterium]|nr:hypothetical protein [Lachnospiraceae bacterium]